MPNDWGDEEENPAGGGAAVAAPPAPATSAANEWGDLPEGPAPATAAAPVPAPATAAAPVPAPSSSATGDFFSRLGQDSVLALGQRIKGAGRLAAQGFKAVGLPLGTQHEDAMRELAEQLGEAPPTAAQIAATKPEDPFQSLAKEYNPDPARAGSVEAGAASILGSAAPVVATEPLGLPASMLGLGGQMGEQQRERALAQGDPKDLADAKFNLGATGGALFAAAGGKLLPTRTGAGVLEKLITRGVEGAAVNTGVEAAQEGAIDQKLDWGALKKQGAFGAGLGLVLGLPEALALHKTFGAAARNVEGKSLNDAVTQIAQESGQPPTEIQRRINEATGVTPVPTAEEHAARGAEVESALGARSQTEAAAENQADGEAAQAKTLFEARLNRRAEAEAAFNPAPETTVPAEARSPTPAPDIPLSSGSVQPESPRAASETAPTQERPGELQNVPPRPPLKGKSWQVGPAPNGEWDLLTAVEDLGGAPGPKRGTKGAEYDGYASAFGQGPARLLRRTGKGGIDTFIPQLESYGYKFSSPDEFYNAINKAAADRVRTAKAVRTAEYGAKFDAAVFSNSGRKAHLDPGEPITSDELAVGDQFKIRGEPVKVTDINPDTGAVRIEDGVKRDVPPGTPIYPDRDSLAKRSRSTDFLPAEETQPLPAGAETYYLGKNFPVLKGVGEPVHQWQVRMPGETGRGRTMTEEQLRAEGYQAPELQEPKPNLSSLPQGTAGSIDPKLIYPIARAAMGGALGYATGNTPEERVRNALIGMGFAMTPELLGLTRKLVGVVQAQPVGKDVAAAADKQLTKLKLALAPQSILPEEIRTQLKWGDQAKTAVTKQGLSLTADLTKDIRGIGDKSVQGATSKAVHEYLTGTRPLEAVPAPARASAEKVRNFVDALSDRAVAEGVVKGTMAQTFLSNRGSYLRRSYDIFLNKDYKPEPAQIAAAVDAVARQNKLSPGEARLYVNDLLASHNREALPAFMVGQGKIAGKDVGSLMAREDLLPEIRALFGEVKDPVLATNQTIPRMASMLEMDATQKNIRDIGLRMGIFRNEEMMKQMQPREVGKWVPLVGDANKPHDNLRGLWTTPEIAQAFQKTAGGGQLAGLPGLLWKAWNTASIAAKTSKVVLSPATYSANFVGHAMFNLASGNFRYNHFGHALALGAEELGALRQFMGTSSPTREALRAELAETDRLGVTSHGSLAGSDLMQTIDQSFLKKLKDPAVNVISFPGKIYNQMFNLNRYVAWKSEQARYTAAFPDKSPEEIKRLAADTVSATTPTYSEIPKWVKQASVSGLAPSFVNFSYEAFRNTYNAARIGSADVREGMRTGNMALVKAGMSRLVPLTIMVAGSSGLGISRLSRLNNKVTDQQDQATRFFGAPWDKEGSLRYQGPIANGKANFSNMEYLLPHAIVTQALDAAMRGASQGQAIESFRQALMQRFSGGNILAAPLIGAITGHDPETGRPIPRTAVNPTLDDRASYLLEKAFEPPGVVWTEKFIKAVKGEQGDFGQVYSTKDQLEQLVAIRAKTVDFNQAMPFKARDLGDQFNQATGLYRSRLKENLTPADLAKAYQNSEQERQSVFADLVKMRQLGNAVGVNDETITKAMKSAQIPARVILGVLDGQYVPGVRGEKLTPAEVMAGILQKPAQDRQAALANVYRQDPTLGKAVVERLRQNTQGLNERDKIIMGLGISDGERAGYIRERLAQLPDVTTRRAWLEDLQQKRILTNTVFAQMTQRN